MKTDEKDTGYIQISTNTGKMNVLAYAFEGLPIVESLSVDMSVLLEESYDQKIYFLGAFSYMIKNSPATFCDISSLEEISVDMAEEIYNR